MAHAVATSWNSGPMPNRGQQMCTLLLSGGIDSAFVAHLLLEQGWSVEALWIDYGQSAARAEERSSKKIASHYDLPWRRASVAGLTIPKDGEIRGRNDLLLSLAAASHACHSIAMGVHAGTDYADCSPPWAEAWQDLLDSQHHGSLRLVTPLLSLNKGEILDLCKAAHVPVQMTHSCERSDVACGECLSCMDREHLHVGS